LLLIAATLEIIGDLALLLRRAELAVIFALWVGVAAVLLALAGWWFSDEALALRRLVGLALVVGEMILLRM
jgi:multidrug transporter EmrE-like cation transporter